MEEFTSKYKPRTLEYYFCDEETKDKVQKYIDNDMRTPIILEGPAGTGKTSLAGIIGLEMNAYIKEINASTDNGVDVVRTEIIPWCKARPLGDAKCKVLILEEAERMTPQAQDALKRTIDNYKQNVIFIFCTNNINKIINPLKSRANEYVFHIGYKADYIIEGIVRIAADKEGMDVDDKTITEIVAKAEGEPRAAINMLQSVAVDSFKPQASKRDSFRNLMGEIYGDSNLLGALQFITEDDLSEFGKFIMCTEKQPYEKRVKILMIIADTDRALQNSINKDIHLLDMMVKLREVV